MRPKKKKVIFMVMPKRDNKMSLPQSRFSIWRLCMAKGKRRRVAPKNRKKARVKEGIFSRASLKIGDAAPQMILAMIRAIIA